MFAEYSGSFRYIDTSANIATSCVNMSSIPFGWDKTHSMARGDRNGPLGLPTQGPRDP